MRIFSGQQRRDNYDVYSFLAFDIDRNSRWINDQRKFRQHFSLERRISFKNLNDSRRRAAMPAFLALANGIEGMLTTFAVSKNVGPVFVSEEDENEPLLQVWKLPVRERLLRILHMSAFLVSGLSEPAQDLLWVIDQDEIASNESQLSKLTEAFGRVFSNMSAHSLGHIRCGTTMSDDGSLALEDLCAISDLAAGSLAELGKYWDRAGNFLVKGLSVPVTRSLSPKANALLAWLSMSGVPLRRKTILITPSRQHKNKVLVSELKINSLNSASPFLITP